MKKKQPLKETFKRIGGKQLIQEKKDVVFTWDEINDALTWAGFNPKRILDIGNILRKYKKLNK